MNNLKIIGIDGIDGTGKTSLIGKLVSDNECFVLTTRRNPSSPYVNEMYRVIHTFKQDFTALSLFVEDLFFRYEQLTSDKIALADRTFISAMVFYKSISELSRISDDNLYERINEGLLKYPSQLSIFLLASVERARERISKSGRPFAPVEEVPFLTSCDRHFREFNIAGDFLAVETDDLDENEVYEKVHKKIIESGLDHLR
ncbi:hypothetical protein GF386_00960 [Candidatus Pacearchaeota archaeon]|nr:hypothetical protein [Candidatus Pacearchaeota archaeon]MBD3282805.1 hypothetical protein [Candidatus Pacearchaeota archaeon]